MKTWTETLTLAALALFAIGCEHDSREKLAEPDSSTFDVTFSGGGQDLHDELTSRLNQAIGRLEALQGQPVADAEKLQDARAEVEGYRELLREWFNENEQREPEKPDSASGPLADGGDCLGKVYMIGESVKARFFDGTPRRVGSTLWFSAAASHRTTIDAYHSADLTITIRDEPETKIWEDSFTDAEWCDTNEFFSAMYAVAVELTGALKLCGSTHTRSKAWTDDIRTVPWFGYGRLRCKTYRLEPV